MKVEVTRGPLVESIHEVRWVVSDATGRVLAGDGHEDALTVLRSAAKPFQAMAALEGGVADAFGLDEREVAILGGSHYGEAVHVEAVRSILAKAGIPEDALQCGAHAPYNAAARAELEAAGQPPLPIHNNCSGKHAGLIALAKRLGAPLHAYMERAHPAQQAVFRCLAAFTDDVLCDAPFGVDGCGLPAPAVPLRLAAASYARWASGEGISGTFPAAARRLREAQRLYPEMVCGAEAFNTRLLLAAPHLVAKGGAEGVFCVGNTRGGLGLALKVGDGASRAAPPAAVALLERLGWVDEAAMDALVEFRQTPVRNVAGRAVGSVRATAFDG